MTFKKSRLYCVLYHLAVECFSCELYSTMYIFGVLLLLLVFHAGFTSTVGQSALSMSILPLQRVQPGTSVLAACSFNLNLIPNDASTSIVFLQKIGDIQLQIAADVILQDAFDKTIRYSVQKSNDANNIISYNLTITGVQYQDMGEIGCAMFATNISVFKNLSVCADPRSSSCQCIESQGWTTPHCFPPIESVQSAQSSYQKVVTILGILLGLAILFGISMSFAACKDSIAKTRRTLQQLRRQRLEAEASKRNGSSVSSGESSTSSHRCLIEADGSQVQVASSSTDSNTSFEELDVRPLTTNNDIKYKPQNSRHEHEEYLEEEMSGNGMEKNTKERRSSRRHRRKNRTEAQVESVTTSVLVHNEPKSREEGYGYYPATHSLGQEAAASSMTLQESSNLQLQYYDRQFDEGQIPGYSNDYRYAKKQHMDYNTSDINQYVKNPNNDNLYAQRDIQPNMLRSQNELYELGNKSLSTRYSGNTATIDDIHDKYSSSDSIGNNRPMAANLVLHNVHSNLGYDDDDDNKIAIAKYAVKSNTPKFRDNVDQAYNSNGPFVSEKPTFL